MKIINGFSKYSKEEKINWLNQNLSSINVDTLENFWHEDDILQKKFDELSENTISNYYMPFGLAPNFLINDKVYCIPMVIEESSVVAAACLAAKFWSSRGGFKGRVISTTKVGHVHLNWDGDKKDLKDFFSNVKPNLEHALAPLSANMINRGGGVKSLKLIDNTDKLLNHYKIEVLFETCEAMGANFINSILEEIANEFETQALLDESMTKSNLEIVMSILSNYTPDCLVEAYVECPVSDLGDFSGTSPEQFALKFKRAVDIALCDTQRAVTHNKGIFNGIDSLVLATGNDFRSVEACAHAYAAKTGMYKSLTHCELENDTFKFTIKIPLSIGTIGGLTNLHPLAKLSLEILGNPDAKTLMIQMASLGLAQNFAAIKSLVTTGIQKGHMKMHLLNILNGLSATEREIEKAKTYFQNEVVSYTSVRNFIVSNRKLQ